MRKTLWLWIALAVCLSACEPDFDEIRDTDQRSVTFAVDVSNMFANVLVPEGDGFVLGDNSGLDDHHRVRVTVRCYDLAGQLVDMATLFTTMDARPEIRIRHLDKNKEYQFVLLADVVEFYSEDNFYETWYQLNDKTIENFYITVFHRNDTAKYNVVSRSIMNLYPENQIVEVDLSPVTYNGYIVFTNYENKDKIEGYTGCYQLFRVYSMQGKNIKGSYYECGNLSENKVMVPVTATLADNTVLLDVRVRAGNQSDSTECSFQTSHRPFVTTVDCQELKVVDCTNY